VSLESTVFVGGNIFRNNTRMYVTILNITRYFYNFKWRENAKKRRERRGM